MADHIRLDASNKALSSLAGLSAFSSAFDRFLDPLTWRALLPANRITPKTTAFEKLKAMTLGLVAGAGCLDDMDRLAQDPAFLAVNGDKLNAARTYDEFLQRFSHEMIKRMNLAMIDATLRLHQTQASDNDFILSCDSSDSEQTGVKLEGVAWNYKHHWCLDTIMAFDQYGFQYWHEVRPGNTYTSNGSPEIIYEIFKRVKNKHLYFLGDSGFCNNAVFTACHQQNADFVIAGRANMYGRFLGFIKEWKSSQIKFHDGRKTEIGHTFYITSESKKIYRLIVLRTKAKEDAERGPAIFEDTRYEYCAFVTTISQHNMSNQDIVELYRKRSNSENFIKELKVGFDMYHYPCRKLAANKAYGVMMALAYNLTRYVGYLLDPLTPKFSKAVRFLLVNIPCQVIRHGRQIIFKMPPERLKEVRRIYEKITQLGYYASS